MTSKWKPSIYQKTFLNSREYDRTSGWKFCSYEVSKFFGSLQIFEMHAWSSLVSLILLIHISNDGNLGQAALRRYFPLHVVDSEQIIAHSKGERVWASRQFAYSAQVEVLHNSANVSSTT